MGNERKNVWFEEESRPAKNRLKGLLVLQANRKLIWRKDCSEGNNVYTFVRDSSRGSIPKVFRMIAATSLFLFAVKRKSSPADWELGTDVPIYKSQQLIMHKN